MAKNQPGVRIEFDEEPTYEEIMFSEANARAWPSYLASPEAGVRVLLDNYGKSVLSDPKMKKSLFRDDRLNSLSAGYLQGSDEPFIPDTEYERLLNTFEMAFEGEKNSLERVNDLLRQSKRARILRMKR